MTAPVGCASIGRMPCYDKQFESTSVTTRAEPATVAGAGGSVTPAKRQPRGQGKRRQTGTVVVGKADLLLAVAGLLAFAGARWLGLLPEALALLGLALPLVTVTVRLWQGRRSQLEYGLLRHPLRRQLRAHLLQCLNHWLFWALFGAAIIADTFANVPALVAILFGLPLPDRIPYPPLAVALGIGAIVMAALALVPGRLVHVATNVLVAIGAVFLGVQLVRVYQPPADPIAMDPPLAGDWSMLAGGRSALVSHHYLHAYERDALDFLRLVDGRGSRGDLMRAESWHGFGEPVLAPADGTVVSVSDVHPDEPVGAIGQTPGEGNHVVLELGERRYAAMAHLKRGSAVVSEGQSVRRGQPLAAVGDSGNSLAPHLHFQVQDRPAFSPSARTVPIVFRNVVLTRGGSEQRPGAADLRRGDSIRRIER